MSNTSGFHVRHDLLPSHTLEIITLLRAINGDGTLNQIQSIADTHGYTIRSRKDWSKPLKSLAELGIVEDEKKHLTLTEVGKSIANFSAFQPDLLPDFIHFLYYTCFDSNPEKRFSWSYRLICDSLWNSAPCVINRDKLVNLVTAQASETFKLNGISFSTNSVYGVLNWLSALSPACIVFQDDEQKFVRRGYCSVELFMLALHHTVGGHTDTETSYVPITPELRKQICQICLLVPDAFSEMLEEAEANFDCLQIRRERGDRIAVNGFSWSTLEG